jgi:polysaccharide pyruvyl transferase WcaK-like protein
MTNCGGSVERGSQAMKFEIVGVSPANKGAVLMLEAIRERLTQAFPDAQFAVPLAWPPAERLAKGVWATPSRTGRRPTMASLFEHAPARLQHALAFIPDRDIDVILDASGFGYGDFWGLPKLQNRLTRRLARWKRPGRRAILLPQALGPFEAPGMAEAFRQALDHLDLAFVRDDASQVYVEAVAPGRSNVHRAPDFTNLLHPELPARLNHLKGRSVVIPNEKMVTGEPAETRTAYVAFLRMAVEAIRRSGREVFILVHEGAPDRALAQELNATLEPPAPIVDERSALVTKAVIGAADLVVSSRFHGLVSALSSGVPALACGWSHKYDELLADYGCPGYSIRADDRDRWPAHLDRFLAEAPTPAFREALATAAAEQRRRSEAMWEIVIDLLRVIEPAG